MTCGVGVTIPFYQQKQRIIHKKNRVKNDMLPPSRTLKYKTYLGVFYVQKKQD